VKPEMIHRFIELRRERDRLKRELSAVEAEALAVEDVLREEFVAAGVQRIGSDDGATLFLAPEVRASVSAQADPSQVKAAFAEHGLGWMVKETIHPSTLSSWVIEQRKSGQEIPPDVLGVINLFEQHRVRVRLSGRANNGEE